MLRFFKTSHGLILPPRPTVIARIHSSQGSHPWPEWVELMDLLLKRGFFGEGVNPFINGGLGSKESNHVRTACLNFARHRVALLSHLSKKDIKVIAGFGCPSTDRKVVNSGKRLRAYVGVEEGNVCGSCNLRGECERAYTEVREEEGARTVDVMRILLTYGLDSVASTVENRVLHTKFVEDSVRKLLREMVEYNSKDAESAKTSQNELMQCSQDNDEIDMQKKREDWRCAQCQFLNFARNIRCLRCDVLSEDRLQQLKEEQKDHLPLKKGDWICQVCNFLNFAKNTRCLRCREKPPKRQLNPGEWECESCNYINFRRNSVCLKCEHKRRKASKAMNKNEESKREVESGTLRKWRMVEEEREERREEEEEGFMDFPVDGGSSIVSKSLEKTDEWKWMMGNRITRRDDELLGDDDNDDDDDDMNGWFVGKDYY